MDTIDPALLKAFVLDKPHRKLHKGGGKPVPQPVCGLFADPQT